jgi:hypothetical protein
VSDEIYYKAGAYHEAGHAILAVHVGAVNIEAELEPFPCCRGRVSSSYGPAHLNPNLIGHRKIMIDLILKTLAGHIAERFYWAGVPEKDRPVSIQNWEGDRRRAEELAEQLRSDTSDPLDIMNQAFAWLEDFFSETVNYLKLERLGEALFTAVKLSDAEIRKILGDVDAAYAAAVNPLPPRPAAH